MKRTREMCMYEFKKSSDIKDISGCINFFGEDLEYNSRKKKMQKIQRDWLKEQMREKENQRQREKEEEMNYQMKVLNVNKYRGAMEREYFEERKNQTQELKKSNLEMAKKMAEEKKNQKE